MTAPLDFQALTRLYVDLWQAQLGQMFGDPALARTMSDSVTKAAAAAMGAGAPPAADTSDLAAIRRRLDVIEARLSALEARRPPARKAARKSGPGA